MTRHRVTTARGRFTFSPEYIAQQGGAIVGVTRPVTWVYGWNLPGYLPDAMRVYQVLEDLRVFIVCGERPS